MTNFQVASSQNKLDRHSPIPLHQQLSDIFIERIKDGSLGNNEKLPSENDLMCTYGISRHVIRQTLNNLRQQGLVYTEHGLGSFVSLRKVNKSLDVLQSYHESMKQSGILVDVLIEKKMIVPTPEHIILKMRTEVKEIFYLERVSCVKNEPINLLISYILPGSWGNNKLMQFGGGSLYKFMEKECGLKLVHSVNNIEICFAQDFESRLLNIARAAVLLQISSLTYDQNEQTVEFTRVIYPGSSVRFHFESYLSEEKDKKRFYIVSP